MKWNEQSAFGGEREVGERFAQKYESGPFSECNLISNTGSEA